MANQAQGSTMNFNSTSAAATAETTASNSGLDQTAITFIILGVLVVFFITVAIILKIREKRIQQTKQNFHVFYKNGPSDTFINLDGFADFDVEDDKYLMEYY